MNARMACKYCIMTKGLRGSDLEKQTFATDEELIEHIEMEHDIPVKRKGETSEQCHRRFKEKNPRAGSLACQYPACQKEGHLVDLIHKLS